MTEHHAPTGKTQLIPALLASVSAVGLGIGAVIRGADHSLALGIASLLVAVISFVLVIAGWRILTGAERPARPIVIERASPHWRWLLIVHVTAWVALLLSLGAFIRAAYEVEVGVPLTGATIALWLIWFTSLLRVDASGSARPRRA